MENYTMVRTDFWRVSEGVMMTPEDKLFYIYLLSNPNRNNIGIYQITRKQMAFELGYSIDTVYILMNRFIEHYKLIRYNTQMRELAIKNWGKYNVYKDSQPVLDSIYSELKDVFDPSLIQYVSESIQVQKIRGLYESLSEKRSFI
ncbi:hypothetical protein ABLO26_21035 [Neobacillus sp. 179-J 1A1 HS]|uniref:hypothetical protein n=1 Tax=Neobacillus driksii TaxID=3035913 RepID=UPI0035BC8027